MQCLTRCVVGRARRAELQPGEFTLVVAGFAPSSQFRLDVELVLPARQLRPVAQIAMGQACPHPCLMTL